MVCHPSDPTKNPERDSYRDSIFWHCDTGNNGISCSRFCCTGLVSAAVAECADATPLVLIYSQVLASFARMGA